MRVYKFGGASVRSAEGVRNIARIVSGERGPLLVVVSAMGKTTNALESVADMFVAGDRAGALQAWAGVRDYHLSIVRELFGEEVPAQFSALSAELEGLLAGWAAEGDQYDRWYDRIVSYGELFSTALISAFLAAAGTPNRWIDMRRVFITDGRYRGADIDLEASAPLLRGEMEGSGVSVYVGQGFIGGTRYGETVTLGREGSDYSAAAAGNILGAQSVTIWKDVPGILSADPKLFPDAQLIPELTYLDAVELAYSGAQVIHPKTIKPLQNKNIPLYVRPFGDPSAAGSVIKGRIERPVDVPILILKRAQVLVSIRPNDFSFVLEERFASLFATLERYGITPNLIQSSAVNLSICVDGGRRLGELEEELRGEGYRVVYNEGMELLTIRGYTAELYDRYCGEEDAFLVQQTRRTLRVVRKA